MSNSEPKRAGIDLEATLPGNSPTEADYDAWVRAKIEAALKEAKEHPERRIPQAEVWKKFGLEP
jgi:hypothetical protein